MRETDFYALVEETFGQQYGHWLLSSHVLSTMGLTALEAMESNAAPLREIWRQLCKDCEIPIQD